jgi:hypothetical protein
VPALKETAASKAPLVVYMAKATLEKINSARQPAQKP